VRHALRAEDALDMLRTERVDLVITEAILPGMDGFEFVRRMRDNDNLATVPVIMLTVRNAPEDYGLGFEAGANEYFPKPLDGAKLIGVAQGLIRGRERARLQRVAGQHQPPAAVHRRSERGEIITIFSLKGGVGTSTLAVNIPVSIKQLTPSSRVGLIDLSLEKGLDALMLDIVPTSTILEWAREETPESTPYQLNQYFIQHRSGISLLAAPPAPEDAEIVRPDVVRRVLELARQSFDYIVVDTASTFNETTLIALESADAIVIGLTPDMAALKTTVSTVRTLKALRIDEDKLRFVLNEIVPHAGLTKEQVETSLRKSVFVIPHAGSHFIEASNHGMPLTTINPPPAAAKSITELARTLCEPEMGLPEPAQTRMGLRTVLERVRRT
jgi:pilus assembly protein CpaE